MLMSKHRNAGWAWPRHVGRRVHEEEEARSGKAEAGFPQKFRQTDHCQPSSMPLGSGALATSLRLWVKTVVSEGGPMKAGEGPVLGGT